MRISDWSSDVCSSDLSTVLRGLSLAFPVRLLGARPLGLRTHRGGDHRLRGDDGGDILRYGRGDRASPVAAAAGEFCHRHALRMRDKTLIWRPGTRRSKTRGASRAIGANKSGIKARGNKKTR